MQEAASTSEDVGIMLVVIKMSTQIDFPKIHRKQLTKTYLAKKGIWELEIGGFFLRFTSEPSSHCTVIKAKSATNAWWFDPSQRINCTATDATAFAAFWRLESFMGRGSLNIHGSHK